MMEQTMQSKEDKDGQSSSVGTYGFNSGNTSINSSSIFSSTTVSSTDLPFQQTPDIHPNNSGGLRRICNANPATRYGMQLQLCRMLSISIIPITVMMGFTAYMFGTNLQSSSESSKIKNNIYLVTEMTSLMHALQRERDFSALYCSAIGPDTKTLLISHYAATDEVLGNISTWPFKHFGGNISSTLATRETFASFLNRHRYELEVEKPTSRDELKFYTTIIDSFIKVQYDIVTQVEGVLWKTLVGMLEIVKARASLGIERSLGTVFFIQGGFFDRDSLLWFLKSQDQGNQTLKMALEYSEEINQIYQDIRKEESEVMTTVIRDMRYLIRDTELRVDTNDTRNDTVTEPLKTASWWFGNMTIYLDALLILQRKFADINKVRLSRIEVEDRKVLTVIGTIFAFVIILTPLMIYSVYKLTKNIQTCSLDLAARTKTLSVEKKRTNQLLYQMLPKAVAEKLKNNQHVEPILFKSATVLFSDIVGFTALSAKSSPVQVVEMLNLFFTTLDAVLELHDVYKVETIGDAYMVASGLPKKNGKQHASEIALVSLQILKKLRVIEIPHMPGKIFHVRIGCNTGPVIAGVVGLKMPRYCLFGKTVTIAAKMEATAKAGCIQIAESTNNQLNAGQFITTERKDNKLEEKTYWLLHKKGQADLQRKSSNSSGSDTAEEFANSLYQDMIEKYSEEELFATKENEATVHTDDA